jgi:uncharacterized protein (TIRG00374 family)
MRATRDWAQSIGNIVKRIALGIILSLAALFLAARNVQLEDLAALGDQPIPWGYALSAGVVLFAAVILRGWRLKMLLPKDDPVSVHTLSGATAILFLVNNLFPARAGEVVRVMIIKKHSGSPLPTLLTAIVVERCLDAVALVLLLAAAIWSVDVSPELGQWAMRLGMIVGIVTIGIVVLEVVHRRDSERVDRWVRRCTPKRFGDRIAAFLMQVLCGLNLTASPSRFVAIVGASLGVWIVTSASFYWLLVGYAPEVLPHTPWAGPIVAGAVALASSIPAAPGYLGVFQLTVKESLEALGSQELAALHYALLLWAVNWLSNNILGLYYGLRLGVGWSDLKQANRSRDSEAAAQTGSPKS